MDLVPLPLDVDVTLEYTLDLLFLLLQFLQVVLLHLRHPEVGKVVLLLHIKNEGF